MATIRRLEEGDDRKGFTCGDVELDRFFVNYAGQNQFRHHIGSTYVASDGARIVGYLTAAAGAIEVEKMPGKTGRGLPQYPAPILRVARLGVALDCQGQGLGPQLLRYAVKLAIAMAETYGCVALVVDAYASAVPFYAKYGFVAYADADIAEGESRTRPRTTMMILPMKTIRKTQPA